MVVARKNSKNDAPVELTPAQLLGHELRLAAQAGQTQRCLELVAQGAEIDAVDAHNETALFKAVGKGHRETVQALLGLGARTDIMSANTYFPLHMAAWEGHDGICRDLVAHGADIEAGTADGRLAIILAAWNHKTQAVDALRELGARLDAYEWKSGQSLLHYAGHLQGTAICDAAVAAALDVNEYSQQGFTPLHQAATTGRPDVCLRLLELGADPLLPALQRSVKPGKKAIELAQDMDWEPCVDVLRAWTARLASQQAVAELVSGLHVDRPRS